MSNKLPLVYDSSTNKHTPLSGSDVLDPVSLPISARTDNVLKNLADGLYVGNNVGAATVYVASTGTNATTSGSSSTPYQTIDYALSQLAAQGLTTGFNKRVSLELKAGETFTMNNDFILDGGQLDIGFFGDNTYGSTNSTFGTVASAWVVANINRPILANVSGSLHSFWSCSKFVLRNGARLTFRGIKIALPNAPVSNAAASSYGTFSDLVTVENNQSGTLHLEGCIVDKSDFTSCFGLAGIQGRGDTLHISQFASQLTIGGVLVGNGASNGVLASRAYFFKLYADFAGNNQTANSLVPASLTSSPGSGLMRLVWSDVAAQVISGGISNLATYPTVADATYGIKNYFTGLIRDQQQRPLNVLSSRLF